MSPSEKEPSPKWFDLVKSDALEIIRSSGDKAATEQELFKALKQTVNELGMTTYFGMNDVAQIMTELREENKIKKLEQAAGS
jgi:uncharacterized protein YqeY